jgi:protein SCO1/2
MTRKILISAALVAALVALLVLGLQAGRVFRDPARAAPPGLTALEPPLALPDFRLHDQNSRTFDPARLRGKWSLVFFGYTQCPDICPTTLVVLRDLRRLAGGKERNVQYVFVSVDPERDNARTLRDYARYFDPELVAVTGRHTELLRLTRALGAYYEAGEARNGRYEVHHSAAIFVIDPEARARALFAGPHDPARLAQGLQRLKGD